MLYFKFCLHRTSSFLLPCRHSNPPAPTSREDLASFQTHRSLIYSSLFIPGNHWFPFSHKHSYTFLRIFIVFYPVYTEAIRRRILKLFCLLACWNWKYSILFLTCNSFYTNIKILYIQCNLII